MSCRDRPAPRPELDPGETPERAGDRPLVAVAPLGQLELEEGADLVPASGRRERVHDGLRRLLDELLAADGRREITDMFQQIP